jgi:site-specific DNA recombinase
MDTEKRRVAIYARVSSQEQAVEGVSIDAQIGILKAYAASQGWEIADEYVDGGYSGGTDERPELRRLFADTGRGRFDVIAVSKLDRFFRNVRLLLNYLHDLEQLDIKFVAVQDAIDTSNTSGRLAVQVIGIIAEFERGRIGERVRDSRQYRVAQGIWPGGQTIHGYRWLADKQEWQIDEKEAELVRYIYKLYVEEKLGTMKIAFRLNEEGFRTRREYLWGFSTISRILSHTAYKGIHPQGYKMPPIIDEEMWDMAQTRCREARHVRRKVRHWLLQGLCICGECGHILSCQQKDTSERRYYSCPGRWKDTHLDGSPRCKLPRIKANLLEWAVWERLKAVLTDSETLREGMKNSLAQLKERREQLYRDTNSVDKKLEAIIARKERLGLSFADGAITRETYKKKLQEAVRIEKDLLRTRDNLSPEDRTEVGELEQAIASLEKTLDSKSAKLLLTELGVQVVDFPEDWIVGCDVPGGVDGLDNYYYIEAPDTLRIPEAGIAMSIVDGPEVNSNLEITRDTIWRNIREIFERLNINVYIFNDRAEIRGYIPTEVIPIPYEARSRKRGAIICSTRGLRGWGQHNQRGRVR